MRTRVLLVDMPRLLGDLVRELVDGDPDLEIVGEIGAPRRFSVRSVREELTATNQTFLIGRV